MADHKTGFSFYCLRRFPSGCFMSGIQKQLYYRVFTQFVPLRSCVRVFSHYYPVTAAALPSPSVRTSGGMVSVFQYAATAEEAAALMASMDQYVKGDSFLSLPSSPAFNGGQLSLF
jgi:hypothetical protein